MSAGAGLLALALPFLAGCYLLHLLLDGLVALRYAFLLQLCSVLRQLGPGGAGFLLLGLALADLPDSALHLLIGLLYNLLGFGARLVEDALLECLDLGQLLLVSVRQAFEGLVGRADLGELLVQHLAVAGDLAQLLFHVDEVAAGLFLGVLHNELREADLAGQLEGE